MIRYNVRSRPIIDIIQDVQRRRLILSPFFQRNLVWRDIHKRDFIDTILKGYPFPQIFIAKGQIDVDRMINSSCIVDGQQRITTIYEFINGDTTYDGRLFKDFPLNQREDFLKYEVPVIDLDMNEDDPALIDVFKRLNRTYYSLSQTERLSTEYSSSEFMLVAKLLTGQLFDKNGRIEYDTTAESGDKPDDDQQFIFDPNIPQSFFIWASTVDVSSFQELMLRRGIFTEYDISRMIHLMFTLNLIATYVSGYYNRNDLAKSHLEEFNENFADKEKIINRFSEVAEVYNRMKFRTKSIWLQKSNVFTLFSIMAKNSSIRKMGSSGKLQEKLHEFEEKLPDTYSQAAREGVNNKKERQTRHQLLRAFLVE